MGQTVLVLGGARGGKSRFAQQLASELGRADVLFVATAEAGDDEMRERIARHQSDRPTHWTTREWPRDLGAKLTTETTSYSALVVDCLTLWVSNILLSFPESTEFAEIETALQQELDSLLDALASRPETAILVSAEVGWGIVPDSPLARRYRDLLGWVNQRISSRATATYLLCAGRAINIQQLSRSIADCASELR